MSQFYYQFHLHTARLFQIIIKGAGRKSLYTFKLFSILATKASQ
jgi:hypothetical protein